MRPMQTSARTATSVEERPVLLANAREHDGLLRRCDGLLGGATRFACARRDAGRRVRDGLSRYRLGASAAGISSRSPSQRFAGFQTVGRDDARGRTPYRLPIVASVSPIADAVHPPRIAMLGGNHLQRRRSTAWRCPWERAASSSPARCSCSTAGLSAASSGSGVSVMSETSVRLVGAVSSTVSYSSGGSS